jgi:DNA-binding MarR family transcriptional regulator
MKHSDDNEIANNLREVIGRLVKLMRKEIRSDEMLSLTERSTLGLVNQHGEMLPSELAVIEKVTNQSMSQIINKLFKEGFIKKTPSKKDKRKVIVTITTAGKDFIAKRRTRTKEWLAKVISEKTSEKEKEILVSSISVLTKLIDSE